MSLDKVLKVTTAKAIKNREQEEYIKRSIKNIVGDDYKVIIMSEGMDIKPLEGSYYGLWTEQIGWLLNEKKELVWYPSKSIAEAHGKKIGFRAKSFNDFRTVTDEEKKKMKEYFENKYTL